MNSYISSIARPGHVARMGTLMAVGTSLAVLLLLALFVFTRAAQANLCGSIQNRVDTAPAGSTVEVPDGCVYRETVTVKKPLTLRGGPGVEVRGSDIWTGWTESGSYWVKGPLPTFSPRDVQCKTNTDRCRWPEQVFFDDEPLLQVASSPESGEFAVDGNRNVILADDPNGHVVEVSVRQYWVLGRTGDVTIEGFAMKHAANPAQTGAISNDGYANWTVRNSDLSYAHGANIKLSQAAALKAESNNVHHAGWVGITSNRADLEVRNNDVHHNNTEDFLPSWAAGGIKVSGARSFVAEGNEVHHNDWNGIWTDGGSENIVVSDNRVHHNLKKGINIEISDRAKVYGNAVWENGWGKAGGGGILSDASRRVEIYGNSLAWNRGASVFVHNADRPQGDGTEYDLVKKVHVHHNFVVTQDLPSAGNVAIAWRKSYAGGNLYKRRARNRGYENRYWYPARQGSGQRFHWNGKLATLKAFNATLGEEDGRYMSDDEKRQVMLSERMPTDPEEHSVTSRK